MRLYLLYILVGLKVVFFLKHTRNGNVIFYDKNCIFPPESEKNGPIHSFVIILLRLYISENQYTVGRLKRGENCRENK